MVQRLIFAAFSLLAAATGPIYAQTLSVYPATAGQPFHAEVKTRKAKVQPDGKQSIQESRAILARDSEGRVFREQLASSRIAQADGSYSFTPHSVSISDPVAMVDMRWDDQTDAALGPKTVLKTALWTGPGGGRAQPLDACQREKGATRSYPNGETQKIEDLGERTIQGIQAHGCRVTTFIPAGAIHNVQPMTVTDDSWTSYEMRLRLLSLHRDPAKGEETTTELDNIVRGEPDTALFQPPPDYQLRDMEPEKKRHEQSQLPVTHPESYAGPWETRDPKSGVIDGIFLWANTEVRQSTEYLGQLQIKVYRREGNATTENWFTAKEGTDTTWDGKRLQLKLRPVAAGDVALNIDLTFDPVQQGWSGTFSRGGLAKQVRLQRPGASVHASNRFVGDWFLQADSLRHLPYSAFCIHVAQADDGTLVVWQHTKSGHIINAPTQNEYAKELAVEDVTFDSIALVVASSKWFGNRVTFTGTLSPDGSQIEGRWATNGQPSPDPVVFIKSSGEACAASSSKQENSPN